MKKGLSSAITSLLIMVMTISSSVYLFALFIPTFGSITNNSPTSFNSHIEILSIHDDGASVELLLYNQGSSDIWVTELLFDNESVPFTIKFSNLTISLQKILLHYDLSIVKVDISLKDHRIIYLMSNDNIVQFYRKGQ